MSVGIYTPVDLLQKWFTEKLPVARKVLRNFPILDELLDGFKGYDKKLYKNIRNSIMFLCLPGVRNGYNRDQLAKLATLEKALEMFNVKNWASSKYEGLKSRIASEDFIQSFSAQTELEAALSMALRVGISNVTLFPELDHGGYSDICVTLDKRPVYIEVGNLGESIPKRKIDSILNESAKHLGKQVNSNCYIQLIVDTAEFIFADGKMDTDATIKKLNSEIDNLRISDLAGFKGFFHFDDLSYILENRELYEKFRNLMPQDERLLRLVNNPIISKWLQTFNSKLLKTTKLVKGIIASPMRKSLLVEIHTEGFYPSKAASLEIQSFLNHITRNVQTQLTERQIQPNAPNIVVVRAHNFLFSTVQFSELENLKNTIDKFCSQQGNANLSGIVIFDDSVENALFIGNPYAKQASVLSTSELTQLGFRYWGQENER